MDAMQQETAPRSTARKVSLVLLVVLLLGQALVVLATIVVAGLGGASAGEAAILFGGVGAASVLLLVLLAGTIRGTTKPVMTSGHSRLRSSTSSPTRSCSVWSEVPVRATKARQRR